MFGQYFDRRFFELQEFIYHCNKETQAVNKNFQIISQQVSSLKITNNLLGGGGLQALESLDSFKYRKGDDKRLSDELREYIKRIYDIREDFIRNSGCLIS
mmetsp:Transcript_44123/g.42809  ORF Transcript_44123/g.42809 Transcript_44123/m.42809 type:complete len:100 (+) Transcript_44123:163-462(+)